MSLCTKDSNSYQECTCASIYYLNSKPIDYTRILSITSSPYSSKVTTEAKTDLLPLKQNGVVGYGTCSTFIGDDKFSLISFIGTYGTSSFDGGAAPSSVSLARISVRCIEDIWMSPLGSAFSTASQNFIKAFISAKYNTLSSLWTILGNSITVPWLYGGTSAVFASERRSMIWWWTLPNISGRLDPAPNALLGHRIAPITGAGFPYNVYSYDALDFSSYCGLYGYMTSLNNTPGSRHYYSFASGIDSSIVGDSSTWWIRYFPEISPGSLYIKFPIFAAGTGGTLETLLKTYFLPFYNLMISPGSSATFGASTWIMRIGLEYIKRPGDTDSFTYWPTYMRTTLINIYQQYLDIRTRILYITLQQILSSRYFGGDIISLLTDTTENPNNTIYLAQWTSPTINPVPANDISNLSYGLRAPLPFLNDGFDPNSTLSISNYPAVAYLNNTIITGFTGFELGVSYTSRIRSRASLIFINPSIDTTLFGNILIYTTGNSFSTTIDTSASLKTLPQLFGANGEGVSYPRPAPRIERPLPPFNPTDPNIVTPTVKRNNIFDVLNTYTLLYIMIGLILIIIIITILVYIFKPNKKVVDIIPKEYTTGKYGYVKYEQI